MHILVHTHLKNGPGDSVQGSTLGLDPDTAVVLEHVLADVPGNGHDRLIARLRFWFSRAVRATPADSQGEENAE